MTKLGLCERMPQVPDNCFLLSEQKKPHEQVNLKVELRELTHGRVSGPSATSDPG